MDKETNPVNEVARLLDKHLRQMFRNNSDCYADTKEHLDADKYREGDVIQAMTEDAFVKALMTLAEQREELIDALIETDKLMKESAMNMDAGYRLLFGNAMSRNIDNEHLISRLGRC